MEAAADVAWDDLATSERVAVMFTHLEGAVGGPQAFKFLGRVRTVASKGGHGDCPSGIDVHPRFWKGLSSCMPDCQEPG